MIKLNKKLSKINKTSNHKRYLNDFNYNIVTIIVLNQLKFNVVDMDVVNFVLGIGLSFGDVNLDKLVLLLFGCFVGEDF